jgi:hypothetical protein
MDHTPFHMHDNVRALLSVSSVDRGISSVPHLIKLTSLKLTQHQTTSIYP